MPRTFKKYGKEMELQIVQEYLNGANSYELAEKYGFKTAKSITDKVRKYGHEVRDSREGKMINKEYDKFTIETIDNEFKAYYIGLMLTDGYVTEKQVGIDMVDEDVIKFLSTTIGKSYSKIKREPPRQDKFRLIMNNPRLISELERYGIVRNKTKTLNGFDLLPCEYKFIPYLIRGIIDGDGWIRKDGGEFYICSASLNFINWTKQILENHLFMESVNIIEYGDDRELWYARTSLKKNVDILKLLVYDKPFGMGRKYDKLHGKSSETTMENLGDEIEV